MYPLLRISTSTVREISYFRAMVSSQLLNRHGFGADHSVSKPLDDSTCLLHQCWNTFPYGQVLLMLSLILVIVTGYRSLHLPIIAERQVSVESEQ